MPSSSTPATNPLAAAAASIARWGLFGVGLALIPVILNAVAALTRQEPNFTLEDLFVHGELLLVSAAVVGAALAELFDQARPRFRVLRIVTGGFSVLLICGASVWFADIAAGIRDSKDLDAHFITMGSLGVFLFAIVAGTSCLVLAQLEERDGR